MKRGIITYNYGRPDNWIAIIDYKFNKNVVVAVPLKDNDLLTIDASEYEVYKRTETAKYAYVILGGKSPIGFSGHHLLTCRNVVLNVTPQRRIDADGFDAKYITDASFTPSGAFTVLGEDNLSIAEFIDILTNKVAETLDQETIDQEAKVAEEEHLFNLGAEYEQHGPYIKKLLETAGVQFESEPTFNWMLQTLESIVRRAKSDEGPGSFAWTGVVEEDFTLKIVEVS